MINYASLIKGIAPENLKEAEWQLGSAIDALRNATKGYKDFTQAVKNGLRVRAREFLIGDADIKAVSFNAPELETLVEIDHSDDRRDLVLGLPLSQVGELVLDRDYFAYNGDKKVYLKTGDFINLVKDNSISGDDVTDAYIGDLRVNALAPLASISGATTKKGFLKVMGALDKNEEYRSALNIIREISPDAQSHKDIYELGSSLERQMLAVDDEASNNVATNSISSDGWIYSMLDSLRTFSWGGVKQVAKTGLALGVAGLMVGGAFGAVFGGSGAEEIGTTRSDSSYAADMDEDAGLEGVVETRANASEDEYKPPFEEKLVAVNGSNPAIYGQIVVWKRDGDIYMKNLTTGLEEVVCNAAGDQWSPAIYNDVVVWYDHRGAGSVHMKNLTTGKESVVCGGGAHNPAIYKDIVVWVSGDEIFMKNLSSNEVKFVGGPSDDLIFPAIYENFVVWTDGRTHDNHTIRMKDLCTGEEKVVAKTGDCMCVSLRGGIAFHDNKVVWTYTDFQIRVKDVITDELSSFFTKNTAKRPAIYNDVIVWEYPYEGEIGMKNLTTSNQTTVCNYFPHYTHSFFSYKLRPAIYENLVVWEDCRAGKVSENGLWYVPDIYMADISKPINYSVTNDTQPVLPTAIDAGDDNNNWWLTIPIGAAAVLAAIRYGIYRKDKGKKDNVSKKREESLEHKVQEDSPWIEEQEESLALEAQEEPPVPEEQEIPPWLREW